jgi:acyl-CoA reductase-like NAD-dependent aldehyde dehydrogenase
VVAPTVLTQVNPETQIYKEEAFGPVVMVEGFSSTEDAAAQLNRGRFGLQAGVFTNDLKALWQLYDLLEVGGVIHNDAPTFRVDQMPYGGVKDSGLGREGIRYTLEDMTERRLLVLRP